MESFSVTIITNVIVNPSCFVKVEVLRNTRTIENFNQKRVQPYYNMCNSLRSRYVRKF
jgi:hypothetical protein